MPTARANLAGAAAPCPSGQSATCVYAIGGVNETSVLGTVEAYIPASNTWTTVAPMPTARHALAAAAAPCPSGQSGTCVYAIGGQTASNAMLGLVEAYDPATNTWSPVAPMPTARRQTNTPRVVGTTEALGDLRVAAATTLQASPLLPTLTLRTMLTRSEDGAAIPGQQIRFSAGNTEICTAMTDAQGTATCRPDLVSLLAVLRNGGYTAVFAGTPDLAASDAKAGLL